MREGDLNKKSDIPGPEKRALKIQKRLEELEEQMKGFGGWSKLPEKEKEQWRKSTRVGLELKYEETSGSLSESDDEVRDDEDMQAIKYRDHWTFVWGHLGSFEDTSEFLHHFRWYFATRVCFGSVNALVCEVLDYFIFTSRR